MFNEDKACIRNDNAAENLDILRKWALNVLQQLKKNLQSIKSIIRKILCLPNTYLIMSRKFFMCRSVHLPSYFNVI